MMAATARLPVDAMGQPSSAAVTDGSPFVLELTSVGKRFERRQGRTLTHTHALQDVSFRVAEHEFVSIIGPSGCGKTTLVRLIAGLLPYTSGTIVLDGVPISGPGPDRAMVFQSASLLPWRNVIDNVQLGLEQQKLPATERRSRAMAAIDLVGLHDFALHYPKELSGGMQQRVGLARALAVNPKVLLMDEPFGALDAITRMQMQDELLRLWEVERKTVVFITHDIEEALLISDRIIVLDKMGTLKGEYDIPYSRPRHRDDLLASPDFARERTLLTRML